MKRAIGLLPFGLVLTVLTMLSGCGGNTPVATEPQPAQSTVQVAISERSVVLGPGEGQQFTATVTGASTNAVIWSISGCSAAVCGTINPSGYYTAPSVVSASSYVQIVATSKADPNRSDTVTVQHVPVSVSVTPNAVWTAPAESVQFTATAAHDVNRGGVTWSLACSNSICGTLSNVTLTSALYTAPAQFPDPPVITLTATSVTDHGKVARIAIGASAKDKLVAGDYAFLFSGWEVSHSGGYYWPFKFNVAGHFRADGNGNIVDGIEDINSIRGLSQSVPFTGTYNIGTDRRGTLTIATAQQAATYRLVLEPSGRRAKFIRFDAIPTDIPVSGAGSLELQDKTAFSLSALTGDYAMAISGTEAGHYWNRIAAVGRFSVGAGGALADGREDRLREVYSGAQPSEYLPNLVLTGSLGNPSTVTGRGTATFAVSSAANQTAATQNFTYYVVSNEKLLLLQTDPRADGDTGSVMSGEARRQHGTFTLASLSGPSIFSMAGLSRDGYGAYYEHVAVGRLVADGSASITGIVDDGGYSKQVANQAFSATYTMAPNGRSELQLGAVSIDRAVAYLFGPNQAFVMETNPGWEVLTGNITPQAPGPFDSASIAGTFLTITAPPASEEAENEIGLTTLAGESSAASSIDVDQKLGDDPGQWLGHFDLTGTYDVAANGRGTITFPSQSRTVVFWVVSPTEMIGNAAMSSDGWYFANWPALIEFTR